MENNIRLIIADDHTLFINGLQQLFRDEKDICVVDIACNGKELLEILSNQPADIILMDINMPELNGLDATGFVKKNHPALKIIMLSTYNDDYLVEKAKTLGANGYLLKTTNKDELLQTIRLVNSGQACFPYRLPAFKSEFDLKDSYLKQYSLTKREIEIMQLIRESYTNQQIADKLYLSIYTVETHRKNIMHKLSLPNPASLIKFIIEHRI